MLSRELNLECAILQPENAMLSPSPHLGQPGANQSQVMPYKSWEAREKQSRLPGVGKESPKREAGQGYTPVRSASPKGMMTSDC